MLILAGISIQAINNTGLFTNAKKAKEKSIEGQLKEEISLAIQSIQTEEIYKGNSVTLETLAGGQLEKELKAITAELADGEINGEYKDYEYTIDSNLNVTINGPVTGLTQKTKYSNIKVTACINSLSKDSNVEEITTKDDSIEYSWEEIAEIAKVISNDTSITDDTETATVIVNGVQKTLNVGDKTK